MPTAHLSRRHACLLFLDHPDYLRLGESALSYSSAPSRLGRLYIMVRDCAGGRSGGIDDDLLMGDDGRDLLLGGEGNDTIFGGEGADRFVVLTQNSGYDVIQDFAIGEDILDLSFTKVRSFDDLVVGIQEDQIVIQGSDGSNISLLHLGESDLDLMNAAQARAHGLV